MGFTFCGKRLQVGSGKPDEHNFECGDVDDSVVENGDDDVIDDADDDDVIDDDDDDDDDDDVVVDVEDDYSAQ